MLVAPAGLNPIRERDRIAGEVLPARHYGSVDVFLEAYESAAGGEVLVIDNGGRTDEGCIGDLTVLEAQAAGISGILVWGLHRDSAELTEVDLPVFSYGTFPAGPQRLDDREPDALATARFGNGVVGSDHVVFADADGAVFVPATGVESVLAAAAAISLTERAQADLIRAGSTIRDQLRFAEYLEAHAVDPSYTFRKYLRLIGGAVEE
jgi:4-hydroxy-4-methyl-2-oxoglutarate aldolase